MLSNSSFSYLIHHIAIFNMQLSDQPWSVSTELMLGKVVAENQKDWDTKLPFVMAPYRASQHESTGLQSKLSSVGELVLLLFSLHTTV